MTSPKTHRSSTTRPFERLIVVKGNKTNIEIQFALEEKVNFVVNRLNKVGAWCRVEYQNSHANVFASNGQKVRVLCV